MVKVREVHGWAG